MLKKALYGLIFGLLAVVPKAESACVNSTPSLTPRAGFSISQINSCGWGTVTNNNWQIVDSSMCIQTGNNNFTGTNTFSTVAGADSFVFGSELHFNSSNNGNWGIILNPTIGMRSLELNANNGVSIDGSVPLDASVGNPALQVFHAQNQTYGSFGVMGSSADTTTAYSGFIGTSPITQSTLWSLPIKDGTNGQFLETDGAAHLSFANVSANAILNQSNLQSGAVFNVSSGTVAGPLAVQGLTATSISGASLSACGDTSHALSWNSGLFGCQAISGGGGAGNNIYPATATPTFPFSLITTASSTFSGANPILSTQTLQSGATIYVSSGTVQTQFNVGTIGTQWTQYNPLSISPSTFAGSVVPIGSLTFTNTSTNGSPKGFRYDDPNGVWVAGIDTLSGLSMFRTKLLISSAASFTSAFPSTFTYQLVAGSITVNGPSDGNIQLTIGGSTYTVTSTSNTGSGAVTVGDVAVFASTNGTLVDGGTKGSGGGGGTPAAPFNSVQYNNAGSFGGSNNFQWNGTSITAISSVTVLSIVGPPTFTENNKPLFSIHGANAGLAPNYAILSVGSDNNSGQLVVNDQNAVTASRGISAGSVLIGNFGASQIISNQNIGPNQNIDLGTTGGLMRLKTDGVANGGGNIVLAPNTVDEVVVSSLGVTISTNVTITGPLSENNTIVSSLSVTIQNGNNLNLQNIGNGANITLTNTGTGGTGILSVTSSGAIFASSVTVNNNLSVGAASLSNTELGVKGATSNNYSLMVTTSNNPSTYFSIAITTNSHEVYNSTAPTVTSCGTNPSIVGTDIEGVITTGSGSPTACTLNFANTYGLGCTVACEISDSITSTTPDVSTTPASATFSFSAALNTGNIYYHCVGIGSACR